MGAVVTFDHAAWTTTYPQFVTVSPAQGAEFWHQATIFLPADGTSPVANADELRSLLFMLTGHIAQVSGAIGGAAAEGLVGRISSASEGGVSLSVEGFAGLSAHGAWFNQTPLGALFWAALAKYRGARYFPGAQRSFEPRSRRWPA